MSFFALVQNDDETGNPTMEFTGEHHDNGYITTVTREMTIEEMERMVSELNAAIRIIRSNRASTPGWETRSYRVG